MTQDLSRPRHLEPLGGSFQRLDLRHRPSSLSMPWGQDHDHVPALQPGWLLDRGYLFQRLGKAIQLHPPAIEMDHLSTSEHHRHFRLVPFFQESLGVPRLELEIVILGLGPKLDLLDQNDRLLLLGLARLLALLVSILPIIHDPADGRLGLRRHLNQIEPEALGGLEGLLNRQDSELFSIRIDDPHLFDSNTLVDPDASTDGRFLLRYEPAWKTGGVA